MFVFDPKLEICQGNYFENNKNVTKKVSDIDF